MIVPADHGASGEPRDASWADAAKYDELYFATRLGEPYDRAHANWTAFFCRVADFIVSEISPRTVLDAGCAIGFLVEALRARGVDARGFDVSEYAISQVPAELRPYCVLGSVTDEIEGSYDLITCIEVLEHLPRAVAEHAIDNFTRHTDCILFSSTPDDESEPTHVNVQDAAAWVRGFAKRGFFPRATGVGLVVSPHAIVFERSEPELVDAIAGYERRRYQLVRDFQGAAYSNAAAATELVALRKQLETLNARLSTAEDEARAGRQALALRDEAMSRLKHPQRRLAAEEARIEELAGTLDEVFSTTWWRLGRPVRGSITFVKTHVLRSRGRRGPNRVRRRSHNRRGGVQTLAFRAGRRLPGPLRRAVRRVAPTFVHGAAARVSATSAPPSVDELVASRFPLLRPLSVFPVPSDGRLHLTVVTDSVSKGSLFGGVGTSMILAAMIARRIGAALRVVTRTERPDPANFAMVLRAHEIDWTENVEFCHSPLEPGNSSIPYRAGEILLTTSWWSTWAALRSVDPKRILYLLQEDERMFYPAGDEQIACSEVLSDPRIRFAVNTRMLHDYFVAEGFGNIAENGIAFEPAFPERMFFHDDARTGDRRGFFFYARPHNVRNLFVRGLEAVKDAIVAGVIDPGEWDLHFVGNGIPPLRLPGDAKSIVSENLPWPEYAALLRSVDVGLSLMSTPHPSYPPLDLAACGAVAVTNRFGPKRSLDEYSENIVCVDVSRAALVEGIATAIELAADEPRRARNYREQQLSRSWLSSLDGVVDELVREL